MFALDSSPAVACLCVLLLNGHARLIGVRLPDEINLTQVDPLATDAGDVAVGDVVAAYAADAADAAAVAADEVAGDA